MAPTVDYGDGELAGPETTLGRWPGGCQTAQGAKTMLGLLAAVVAGVDLNAHTTVRPSTMGVSRRP